jgi:hypothetical protein
MGKIVLWVSMPFRACLVLFEKIYLNPRSRMTYMGKIVLKMGFNAFSGLHGGLVLFEKIYLNPRSRIGLIWEKLF